jgi:hypothetical protein
MIKMIEDKFKSRPLVLFYSDLRKDPYLFLEKIARFIGADFDKKSIDLSPKHRSFNEKQLKIIRKFSRFLFSQDFEYSDKYWVSKIQRLFRMIPRYFILFVSLAAPNFLVPKPPLIAEKELEKVRKHYEDDWNNCLEYASASKNCFLFKKDITGIFIYFNFIIIIGKFFSIPADNFFDYSSHLRLLPKCFLFCPDNREVVFFFLKSKYFQMRMSDFFNKFGSFEMLDHGFKSKKTGPFLPRLLTAVNQTITGSYQLPPVDSFHKSGSQT